MSNPKKIRFAEIAAAIVLLASAFAAPAGADMQMVALDVGEGQAVVFEKNGHGLLVDAGPVHQASEMVRDLRQYGVEKLDWLVLTHLHPDHAGGMFRVIEAWPGVKVIENGHRIAEEKASNMVRWSVQVLEAHDRVETVGAGDTIHWQGARIRFLWPEKIRGTNLNQNSLVLCLSYAGKRVLIMGDVGIDAEQKLLEKGVIDKPADVLVAGHHGSKHTSSTEFLKEVSPAHAIVSIDKNNFRGYPHPKTVDRLEKFSRKLHMTWYGDVVLTIGEKTGN